MLLCTKSEQHCPGKCCVGVRRGCLENEVSPHQLSVNRSVDNNLENPCKTEASRKAVPLDLRIVPFFQRWYEVSLFKAADNYVFAAGSNRAGGEESNPSVCPWFFGIT